MNYLKVFIVGLFAVLLSSCSKMPEIVGKWHPEGEPGKVTEFFLDGTYTTSGKPPGRYELLDGGKRLKLTVGGTFTFVLEGLKLESEQLKGSNQGEEIRWVRAKN